MVERKVFECDNRNGHAIIVVAETVDEARQLSGCYDVTPLDLSKSEVTDFVCDY